MIGASDKGVVTLSGCCSSTGLGLMVSSTLLYSSILIGIGNAPLPEDPTNPKTPGVLRIAYHTSVFIIMLMNT
jgi:hypothetical protein